MVRNSCLPRSLENRLTSGKAFTRQVKVGEMSGPQVYVYQDPLTVQRQQSGIILTCHK